MELKEKNRVAAYIKMRFIFNRIKATESKIKLNTADFSANILSSHFVTNLAENGFYNVDISKREENRRKRE